MSTKFEQLLDYLVNEEHEKANELFHEIVVEKSRDIYENLIAEEEQEDESVEEAEEEADESVDEAEEEEDESVEEAKDEEADESMDLEDSYQMDGADDGFGGGEEGDATDKFGDEIGAGSDEEEEKSEDDAIFDIKNAIQELEAAFAELEKAQGAETGAEFGGEEEPSDEEEPEDEMMGLREYRETVKDGHGAERKGRAEGEIAGANTGEKMPSGTNTKSAINANADRTKPTSGANAKNLNQGDTGEGVNTGTSPNGKTGGLVGGVKGEFTKGVEKNISSSSKSSMKSGSDLGKQGAGYPGNNKSAGPVGSGTGDKAGQTSVRNDGPLIKHIK